MAWRSVWLTPLTTSHITPMSMFNSNLGEQSERVGTYLTILKWDSPPMKKFLMAWYMCWCIRVPGTACFLETNQRQRMFAGTNLGTLNTVNTFDSSGPAFGTARFWIFWRSCCHMWSAKTMTTSSSGLEFHSSPNNFTRIHQGQEVRDQQLTPSVSPSFCKKGVNLERICAYSVENPIPQKGFKVIHLSDFFSVGHVEAPPAGATHLARISRRGDTQFPPQAEGPHGALNRPVAEDHAIRSPTLTWWNFRRCMWLRSWGGAEFLPLAGHLGVS